MCYDRNKYQASGEIPRNLGLRVETLQNDFIVYLCCKPLNMKELFLPNNEEWVIFESRLEIAWDNEREWQLL